MISFLLIPIAKTFRESFAKACAEVYILPFVESMNNKKYRDDLKNGPNRVDVQQNKCNFEAIQSLMMLEYLLISDLGYLISASDKHLLQFT